MTFGELKKAIEDDFAAMSPKQINGYTLGTCARKAVKDILEGYPYKFTVEAKFSHKTVFKFSQEKPFSADVPLISGRLPGSIVYGREKVEDEFRYVVSIHDYDQELYPDILNTDIADFLLVEAQRLEYATLEKRLKERTLYLDMIHLAQKHGFTSLAPLRYVMTQDYEPKLSIYYGEEKSKSKYDMRIPLSMADEISSTFSDVTMKEVDSRLIVPAGWDGSASVQNLMETMDSCREELRTRKAASVVKEPVKSNKGLYFVGSTAYSLHKAVFSLKEKFGETAVVEKSCPEGVIIRSLFSEEFLGKEASASSIEEIQKEDGTCYWAILNKDTMELSFGKGQSGKDVPYIGNNSVAIVTSRNY